MFEFVHPITSVETVDYWRAA